MSIAKEPFEIAINVTLQSRKFHELHEVLSYDTQPPLPPTRQTPRIRHPSNQVLSGMIPPPPPREADSIIRSTSGRYRIVLESMVVSKHSCRLCQPHVSKVVLYEHSCGCAVRKKYDVFGAVPQQQHCSVCVTQNSAHLKLA